MSSASADEIGKATERVLAARYNADPKDFTLVADWATEIDPRLFPIATLCLQTNGRTFLNMPQLMAAQRVLSRLAASEAIHDCWKRDAVLVLEENVGLGGDADRVSLSRACIDTLKTFHDLGFSPSYQPELRAVGNQLSAPSLSVAG